MVERVQHKKRMKQNAYTISKLTMVTYMMILWNTLAKTALNRQDRSVVQFYISRLKYICIYALCIYVYMYVFICICVCKYMYACMHMLFSRTILPCDLIGLHCLGQIINYSLGSLMMD